MYELTIKIYYGSIKLNNSYWMYYEFNDYDIFSIIYYDASDLNKKLRKNMNFYKFLLIVLCNSHVNGYTYYLSDNIQTLFRLPDLKEIKSIIKKIPDSKILDSLYEIFQPSNFIEKVLVKMYIKYRQDLIDFNTRLEYLVNNK